MPLDKFGPYRIEDKIGRGGMGTVFRGVDDETGQVSAVKVLSSVHADDENFRERFGTEIDTLKKLSHENIVQMHGFGEHDGYLFYSMELIDGPSLQEELNRGRRFSWQEATQVGIQICRALKHAHDRGVVHRDLKPANLLLASSDPIQVKLSDFGIAKLFGVSQMTGDGGVLGTADYMAPEQAAGNLVSARSDLFSLGCLLYALLAGRPPFSARTSAESLHRLRFEQPPRLRSRVSDMPTELERIVMQLLEKDPAERQGTALAVSNRLQAMEHALGRSSDGGSFEEAAEDDFDINDNMLTSKVPLVEPTNSSKDTVLVPDDQEAAAAARQSASTPPTPPTPPPKAENRFVTMDEVRETELANEPGETQQLLLTVATILVALIGIGGLVWYTNQPLNESELYRRIRSAAEDTDVAKLADEKETIDELIRRFPDSNYVPEMRHYLEDIQLFQLQRQYARRAKRSGGVEDSAPVEQAYVQALKLATTDPGQAIQMLEGLVAVFDGRPEATAQEKRCLQLAAKQAERLRRLQQVQESQTASYLSARLAEARRLEARSPAEARKIYAGVVALYSGRAWAAKLLQQCEQGLARLAK